MVKYSLQKWAKTQKWAKSGQAVTIEISTFSRVVVKNPLFFTTITEKKLNIYIDYKKKWPFDQNLYFRYIHTSRMTEAN